MKVKYIPYQPHCFAFGGFEIQMLSTLDAVVLAGVEADKMDVWSRNHHFDLLHCWGLGFHHYENIRWAKFAKKKVVLTALLSYYEQPMERIRHFFSTYLKKAQYYIQIANMVDAIVVVNEQQADICTKYFKVPESKIHVIPHVVGNAFFNVLSDNSPSQISNPSGYVLTVGSVCNRKNQLNLAKACIKKNIDLIIIGKVLEGEDAYGNEIEKLIEGKSGITWIKGMEQNSERLISIYQGSSVVALPSYIEQQPITLLEAAVLGKPILVADRAYARQKYYANAMIVDPFSISSIAAGLKKVIDNPSAYVPSVSTVRECRSEIVGERYASLYKELF